ncbi:MAG: beta-galactosidase GalB [Kiritimatiellota bacterium]|nr:beta-galactosidase GalB [Kiritimatiellota bacterium]
MNTDILQRQIVELKDGWRFAKGEHAQAGQPGFDDSAWETVRVPHDWAIKGPFDPKNDMQYLAIIQDGMKKPLAHTGRTGGLPIDGVAWYRKEFAWPDENRGKTVYVEFDGVMSNSTVFINGTKIGAWPYGYSSFSFELTGHLRIGAQNVLAVRLEPRPLFSRWYPGAGIYRHVRLVSVNPVHVAHWGTRITTPQVSETQAVVKVITTVRNASGQAGEAELTTSIIDPQGREAASVSARQQLTDACDFEQSLDIAAPSLWDIAAPHLYRAISVIRINGKETDRYETRFGIRTLRFDKNEGFFLNGRHLNLKGVCQHHDLGPLGSAVNRRGIERQLEILRDMGCNAIRTSHNPPAPELLDLCDEMGLLVMDEAFDEWKAPKMENGYHLIYAEWAEKDLRAMIRRDRNHPCVIIWSIGNEVPEQNRKDGALVAKFLTDICHDEDATRPVTAGFNGMADAIGNGLAAVVDIPGWNYQTKFYQKCHQEHPDWIMCATETGSGVSSRGIYHLPVQEEKKPVLRSSRQLSSYDMVAMPWGVTPDYEFQAQEECPFMLGEFVWTGFDYLGEPSPYYAEWPSRSSYFGIIDLCGHPKDRFYLYRSHWSDRPTLHLLPHWNWPFRDGEIVPVYCYTNCDSAELFLNGRSLGVRRKNPQSTYDRYRLRWNEVKYEPGVLKVVAFDRDGKALMTREVKTAGAPARVELEADRCRLKADGDDLCYITARITDQEGNLCPLADNAVSFEVRGAAEKAAVGNGDPTSIIPFHGDAYPAFNGLCLLIVRAKKDVSGSVGIKAESPGLTGAQLAIESCR